MQYAIGIFLNVTIIILQLFYNLFYECTMINFTISLTWDI